MAPNRCNCQEKNTLRYTKGQALLWEDLTQNSAHFLNFQQKNEVNRTLMRYVFNWNESTVENENENSAFLSWLSIFLKIRLKFCCWMKSGFQSNIEQGCQVIMKKIRVGAVGVL